MEEEKESLVEEPRFFLLLNSSKYFLSDIAIHMDSRYF
jgi:hypothetical protein